MPGPYGPTARVPVGVDAVLNLAYGLMTQNDSLSFQDLILTLHAYWSARGCL